MLVPLYLVTGCYSLKVWGQVGETLQLGVTASPFYPERLLEQQWRWVIGTKGVGDSLDSQTATH